MNCDEAFELLTSRDGRTSESLDAHLQRCPRCREMQEILSPALDWLAWDAEAPVPDRRGPATAFAPLLTAQAVSIAEEAARRLPGRRSQRLAWWRQFGMITAIALGGVLIGLFSAQERPPQTESAALTSDPLLAACLWTSPGLRSSLSDSSPRSVVVSCVMCHVPSQVE